MIRAVLCTATLVAVAVFAPATHAATKLTVSPAILETEGAPGDSYVEDITITAGSEALTIEFAHADFGFDSVNYGVQLIRDSEPKTTSFSTRGWFSVPKKRFQVPANSSVTVPLRITIPGNAAGGTALGAAMFRAIPEERDGGSQVITAPETGSLIFIAVEGGKPPNPKIRTFSLPRIVGSGPLRPRLQIENRGDTWFTFDGTIRLTGKAKDSVSLRQQYVIPEQPRTILDGPNGKRPVLGDSKLGFGRYTVEVDLLTQPGGFQVTERRTVWVIPTWLQVVLGLVVLAIAVSIALLIRWYLERREMAIYLAEEIEDLDADSEEI